MSPAIQSQVLGLSLGLMTAVGCIFYEKLVHHFSYPAILIIIAVEVALLFPFAFLLPGSLADDWRLFRAEPRFWGWAGAYIATGVTSMLWYVITKKQDVMVGAIYEIKYVIMLAVGYALFGDKPVNRYTILGILFALASIYSVSKS